MSSTCVKPWIDDSVAANGRRVKDNFADWFGQSQASLKMSGEPLVLYRGDKSPPDRFDAQDRREHGLFFAVESERAAFYGEVREYALKVDNPLDLRDPYGAWRKGGPAREIIESLYEEHFKGDTSPEGEPYDLSSVIFALEGGFLWRLDGTGGWNMRAWRELQHMTQAYGYDCLIVADDGEGAGAGIDWIVFDSSQVKCVSHHGGLFLQDGHSVTDIEAAKVLRQAHEARELACEASRTLALQP